MISSSLISILTGLNQLSKGHRPQLTSLKQSGPGFSEYWTIVNQSWSQLFEKGPKKPDWTGPEGTNCFSPCDVVYWIFIDHLNV